MIGFLCGGLTEVSLDVIEVIRQNCFDGRFDAHIQLIEENIKWIEFAMTEDLATSVLFFAEFLLNIATAAAALSTVIVILSECKYDVNNQIQKINNLINNAKEISAQYRSESSNYILN